MIPSRDIPETLLEAVGVDPESPSGVSWTKPQSGRRLGPAGCQRRDGYFELQHRRKKYLAHRIVWTLLHGQIPPDKVIDHRDGDPSNNAPENLRLVSQSVNVAHGYALKKSKDSSDD